MYAGFSLVPYAELRRRAEQGANLLSRLDPISMAGAGAFLLLLLIGGWPGGAQAGACLSRHLNHVANARHDGPRRCQIRSSFASPSPHRASAVVLLALALAAAWLWRPFGPRSAKFVEYPMTVPTDIPTAVAVAADGSVWFSIDFSDAVGVVRNGKVERFVKASRSIEPIGIAVDTRGKIWVTNAATVSIVAVSRR